MLLAPWPLTASASTLAAGPAGQPLGSLGGYQARMSDGPEISA